MLLFLVNYRANNPSLVSNNFTGILTAIKHKRGVKIGRILLFLNRIFSLLQYYKLPLSRLNNQVLCNFFFLPRRCECIPIKSDLERYINPKLNY